MRIARQFLKSYPLINFFILCFFFSWILGGFAKKLWPGSPLSYLGLFGPALSALILALVIEGRSGVLALLSQFFVWRVGFRWYLIALFLPFAEFIVAAAFVLTLNLAPILPDIAFWHFTDWEFLQIVLSGILFYFIAAIGEELGWRGFALPKLQAKYHPLAASIIIGWWWGLWHFDELFRNFASEYSIVDIFSFIVGTICASVIYTWLYNNTKGSLLIICLFHAMHNITVVLVTLEASTLLSKICLCWIDIVALGIIAFVIIIKAGPHLSYKVFLRRGATV